VTPKVTQLVCDSSEIIKSELLTRDRVYFLLWEDGNPQAKQNNMQILQIAKRKGQQAPYLQLSEETRD
jgi:DNA-binding SARP family transcriptional activator